MNVTEAKALSLPSLLQRLGFNVVSAKKAGEELWYASPFREEKTASFHVHTRKNVWYDFGLGHGGNILDFVMTYYNQNLSQALITMERLFTSEEKKDLTTYSISLSANQLGENTGLVIQEVLSLKHRALKEYLTQRRIPWSLAQRYLQQVHFSVNGKNYFALGFQNNQGGWELRNKYFQGTSSPKAITILTGHEPSSYLRVFEGFMDFLSYLVIKQETNFQGTVLVLNSLALFSQLESHLQCHTYQAVIAFFDNDQAGQEAFHQLQKSTSLPLYDRSSFYQNHKDLNAYLIAET